MRRSRVLKKIRNGEVVSCIYVHLNPHSTDIAAMSGFDSIWLDNEHQGQNWDSLQAHVWAAKNHDVDVMIRVSRGSYSDYIKPLELDAAGIMVPHVKSVEDARKVVQITRFHPIGRRPVDGGNADGKYAQMDLAEYTKQANEQRFVVIQIEDPEPLDELDEIAALDGIDMLFYGPVDFSHGIGALGQWEHPEVTEARKRVAEAANKHGKYAGTTVSLENAEEMIQMGYRFLAIVADIVGLGKYYNGLVKGLEEIAKR